jgi:proteasome activator-like protein
MDVSTCAPDPAEDLLVELPKITRLRWMVAGIVRELHEMSPDEVTAERLRQVHRRVLIEVGSTLSDDLLAELGRFTPPPDGDRSVDELRVAEAQLLGWLDGLLGVLAGV